MQYNNTILTSRATKPHDPNQDDSILGVAEGSTFLKGESRKSFAKPGRRNRYKEIMRINLICPVLTSTQQKS